MARLPNVRLILPDLLRKAVEVGLLRLIGLNTVVDIVSAVLCKRHAVLRNRFLQLWVLLLLQGLQQLGRVNHTGAPRNALHRHNRLKGIHRRLLLHSLRTPGRRPFP